MHDAALAGDTELIAKLIDESPDVDQPDAMGTPLLLALFARQNQVAHILVRTGDVPNQTGLAGAALTLGFFWGDESLPDDLLRAGADPSNGDSRTPLISVAA